MGDEYETALPRGRSSRHTLGRVRWLMLVSIISNVFLLYKVFSDNGQITDLNIRKDTLMTTISDKDSKQARLERLYSELLAGKNICNKHLSDSEDLVSQCRRKSNECSENLDSSSSKLQDISDKFQEFIDGKEKVDNLFEKCTSELNEIRELAENLRADLAAEHRRKEANAPAGERKLSTGSITQNEGNQATVIKEVGNGTSEHEKEGRKDEKQNDDSAPYPMIHCVFNEIPRGEKCSFSEDSTVPDKSWKIGESDVIRHEIKSDQGQAHVTHLYIDDSFLPPGVNAGITFPPIKSKQCLEVFLTFLTVASGAISIQDDEQVFEVSSNNTVRATGWQKKKFLFKQSPIHIIKLTGSVLFKGGAGISEVSIYEEKCLEHISQEVDGARSVTADQDNDEEIIKEMLR